MNPFIVDLLGLSNDVIEVTAEGETVAYTWFGRPNYAYSASANKYWIGVAKDTDAGTTQFIIEYDITSNTYTATKLGSYYAKDDHNQPQILIRQSDGRLIAFYNEHDGLAIRYRISTNPYDSTSWDAEIDLNPYSDYSYVSPYQTSDGTIFIFFRTLIVVGSDITATWYYMKSTDGAATFGSAVEFYANGATQCYVITSQNGDTIHFASTNGHPQHLNEGNISVFHFYFDMSDETFHKSDGTSITAPITVSDATPVYLTTAPDTAWISDISFKNGLPRILYPLYPAGMTTSWFVKELWFVEWDGSAWVNNQKIAQTMQGYMQPSVTEYCYEGASRFDNGNPDIIWMPKQVNGILEIHKVDLTVNPVFIDQITFNSTVNNWRPISLPCNQNNLLWLRNNVYNSYTDYSISLLTTTISA